MFRICYGLFLFLLPLHLLAGNSAITEDDLNWQLNPFENKVFIENNGQFNGLNYKANSSILFGVDNKGTQIYFTKTGLTYRIDKYDIKENEDFFEEESHEEEMEWLKERLIPRSYTANLEWLGANPSAQLIAKDAVPEYYNYRGDNTGGKAKFFHANAYKKIIYENLYPNIDVEYAFHPKEGIKYTIILHPGADPSVIKMKWSGEKEIFLESNNVNIPMIPGNIIDHAPVSFYEKSKTSVPSSFKLENGIISFDLSDYDRSQTLIIDPWTINPAFTTFNGAYDIATDPTGNIFVYGGSFSYVLKKYTSAGVLLWTYSTSPLLGSYYGDFAVDLSGNTYLCDGAWGGMIVKLDPAGTMLFSTVVPASNELWRISFDCNYTHLILGGYIVIPGGTIGQIARVNPTTGVASNITVITGSELRSLAVDPSGNTYSLNISMGGGAGGGGTAATNELVKSSPLFASVYTTTSGYTLGESGASYTSTLGYNGFNGVVINPSFIYTFDGLKIYKRNIATGGIITSINVPGGIIDGNSGIALDGCGNVYAGSGNNKVYKYDASLTLISSANTPGKVYDVCMGTGGEVLACGDGFVASLNLSACQKVLTLTPSTTSSCGNFNDGSATVTVTGGTGPYTYSWLPGNQSTQSITGIGPGTYTVIVMDVNGCNGGINSTTLTLDPGNNLQTTSSLTQDSCEFETGIGTAFVEALSGTAPYTYIWYTEPNQTTQSVSGLVAGTYTAVVQDNKGCIDTITIIIECFDTRDFTFYAPNTFTPNGDGLNDFFIPYSMDYIPETFTMHIFDRWGSLIHTSRDITKGWDGKANGGKNFAQVDTYVWKISIETQFGEKLSFIGKVNLIR